jgi:mannose-6-phosphate isomerase-like protein (cupin superfamily)
MKSCLIALFFPVLLSAKAQKNHQNLDTIKAPAVYENIYARSLYTDSATVSGFVIFIKKEVKLHKHVEHTEQVLVLDGEALMTLGEKEFKVKKGDLILIPKNTFHSVKTTSKKPLKVLSVQAPFFDGKDRVFKE